MLASEKIESLLRKLPEHFGCELQDTIEPDEDERVSSRLDTKDWVGARYALENLDRTLTAILPLTFPLSKPEFFIDREELSKALPHIEPDGFICYTGTTVSFDIDQPGSILHEAFQNAVEVVESGLKGNHSPEAYIDEFQAYWRSAGESKIAFAHYIPKDSPDTDILVSPKKEGLLSSTASLSFRSDDFNRETRDEYHPKRVYPAFSVELPGLPIPPPTPGKTWTAEQWRSLFQTLADEDLEDLTSRMEETPKSIYPILFSVDRETGGNILFGVIFCPPKTRGGKIKARSKKVPVQSPQDFEATALVIKRFDREFFVRRGGGKPALKDHSVTLIGVGAVGGVAAELLARNGVGKMILVDDDYVEHGNVLRQQHSVDNLEQQKADAVRRQIVGKVPSVEIEVMNNKFQDLTEAELQKLDKTDAIIVAIGDMTVERWINRFALERENFPPVIYTWVEPLGIGGHTVVTKNEIEGCFECILSRQESASRDEKVVSKVVNFADPDQDLATRIAGCSSSFLPFGSMDATRTARQTAEIACDVILDEEVENIVTSWKGDSEDFLSAGGVLGRRYEVPSTHLTRQRICDNVEKICGYCRS
jgi:molybdopterin/thiamine biosynthesis adenylyltransferase